MSSSWLYLASSEANGKQRSGMYVYAKFTMSSLSERVRRYYGAVYIILMESLIATRDQDLEVKEWVDGVAFKVCMTQRNSMT